MLTIISRAEHHLPWRAIELWTQRSIDRHFDFQNEESVLKLFDQLQRGTEDPGDINECLDVAPHHGKLYSLSTKRLAALQVPCPSSRERRMDSFLTILQLW